MSVNGHLSDALTRHQIFVERFGGGIWKQDIEPIVTQMRDDLASLVSNAQLSPDEMWRVNAVIADLDALIESAQTRMQGVFDAKLPPFANYELQFNERLLGGVVSVELAGVSVATVEAVATRTPLVLVSGQKVEQATVEEIIDHFAGTVSQDVSLLLRAGVIEGRTSQELAREVFRMVNTRTKQQAEALTRTVTMAVSSEAGRATGEANSDLLSGERWTATLDSRTTLLCAGRDGKIYPVGEGPYPPAHFRCRSRRVWVVKPEFALPGFEGERSAYNGPVSGNTTYQSWLKKQPAAFQDEVLGPERAALFRQGKVSLDRFTDDLGRTYTLEELAAREGLTLQ